MTYNIPITIQRLDLEEENWLDYYPTHSRINKASAKEYFNASTNITNSTFNFEIRYCKKIEDLIFNTASYRIKFGNRFFQIKNVDDKYLKHNKLTIVGEYYE